MVAQPSDQPDREAVPIGRWITAATAFAVVILVVGLTTTGLIATLSEPGGWAARADIGDSFGLINAVVAGFGLAALIVTLRLQSRELALQRRELQMQRQSLDQSRVELFRSAEANLRSLHVDLIKMSLDDPSLAATWPPLDPDAPPELERQYLYANLIYQHSMLSCRINGYSEEQWQNRIRYLFTSPVMRRYWQASSRARMSQLPNTPEFVFGQAADRIYNEYEELLAATRPTMTHTGRPHGLGPIDSGVGSSAST